ncbi:hypothetical protein F4810DRAFT_715920 [Camillea tinctor]|nr:hypothetical protein F4810DRAFT_715920 [Camillea tinctor]
MAFRLAGDLEGLFFLLLSGLCKNIAETVNGDVERNLKLAPQEWDTRSKFFQVTVQQTHRNASTLRWPRYSTEKQHQLGNKIVAILGASAHVNSEVMRSHIVQCKKLPGLV